MNVIFFGSSSFSIPVLEKLLASACQVVCVVTTPDQKKGRGQKIGPTVVNAFAEKRKIPVIAPKKLSEAHVVDTLKRTNPDFVTIASYGKIVPASIFTMPKIGALNVHPSLLPKHRGASPIQRAILEGDVETGVSIAEITKELDAGDVFGQITTRIDENEHADELSNRLAVVAGDLLIQVIEQFMAKKVTRTLQDGKKSSYAKKIEKKFGHINWNMPAIEVHRQVRAYYPWPAAFTLLKGKRMKVLTSRISADAATSQAPGTILKIHKESGIQVQSKQGALNLIHVQLEGKREMSAYDCAMGQRLQVGDGFAS